MPVMSTLMACEEGMETEQALNEVLGMVDNYTLNGELLSLNRARMAPLAPVRRPAARPDVRPAPESAPHRPLPTINRNPGTHCRVPTGSPVSPNALHLRVRSRLACDGTGGARAPCGNCRRGGRGRSKDGKWRIPGGISTGPAHGHLNMTSECGQSTLRIKVRDFHRFASGSGRFTCRHHG
jgi:hypothetical protein